jgi:hypothetical protein
MGTESDVYDNYIQWAKDQSRKLLMPNAKPQAPPRAAATQERRLFPVACTRFIGKESCSDNAHTWQGAVRESRNMHPRMTNMHADAREAYEYSFASAGALAFVNE